MWPASQRVSLAIVISGFWKVRMTSLQVTVRRYLTPILLLLLAGGFLVVLGELYLISSLAVVRN